MSALNAGHSHRTTMTTAATAGVSNHSLVSGEAVKDNKAQQDKYHQYLQELLKEEDNKFCADCKAKGPRWASHNLGVFLCIRCAGIHRNLGVHVSKVKSVNLDSWSEDQMEHMIRMGNHRAHAVYEAKLSDAFQRPQTDASLEAFIRAKYEHKKHAADGWQELIKQPNSSVAGVLQSLRVDSVKQRRHHHHNNSSDHTSTNGTTILKPPPPPSAAAAATSNNGQKKPSVQSGLVHNAGEGGTHANSSIGNGAAVVSSTNSASIDLLGLGDSSSATPAALNNNNAVDVLASALSANNINNKNVPVSTYAAVMPSTTNMNDLIGLSANNTTNNMTNDSILSLFGSSTPSSSTFTNVAYQQPQTSPFVQQQQFYYNNNNNNNNGVKFHNMAPAAVVAPPVAASLLQSSHPAGVPSKQIRAFDDLVKF